jgi:hypothetical protein
MIYLPSSRRHLLTALFLLSLILFYRSNVKIPQQSQTAIIHHPIIPEEVVRVPLPNARSDLISSRNLSANHLSTPSSYYYDWNTANEQTVMNGSRPWNKPIQNPHLSILWKCPRTANRYTNHIRLPNIIQNISSVPAGALADSKVYWNPTVIALPYWAENQYLVISRILTSGNHQENVFCEAIICYTGSPKNAKHGEKPCTLDDIKHVGPAGGLRCVSKPQRVNVPPTPAKLCEGYFSSYADIPGFHDPRAFCTGRGEPLMIVNTQ